MKTERFNAEAFGGHKEAAVKIPFDPTAKWSITASPLWRGRRRRTHAK